MALTIAAFMPGFGSGAQALTIGQQVPAGSFEAVGQLAGSPPVRGCTATVISPRMVLTAAHCVCPGDNPSQCATRAGIVLRNVFPADNHATARNEAATRTNVTIMGRVRVHPEYGSRGWAREDLAVIDLDQPVSARAPTVAPISVEDPKQTPLTGDVLTLIGYGATGPKCRGASGGKRQLSLSVTEANFAAIHFDHPGRSVCAGDSGGPVINGRGRMVGVASHAAKPGNPGRHSWYRPTSFSFNWIFNLPRRNWSYCKWVPVERAGINSHGRGGAWCSPGTYMVQFDLDGNRAIAAHDAPVIGQALCCGLANVAASWGSCSWINVQRGGISSHAKRPGWCSDGSYLTAFDLEGDRNISANDAPTIGGAYCCRPSDPSAMRWGSMYWIDVEHVGEVAPRDLNSHSPAPPTWCLGGAFMTRIDLDGDRSISDHDAPVVGAVKCARPRP
ncbi:MAG: S1 family peptidase [Pseudomonadota bacterium]